MVPVVELIPPPSSALKFQSVPDSYEKDSAYPSCNGRNSYQPFSRACAVAVPRLLFGLFHELSIGFNGGHKFGTTFKRSDSRDPERPSLDLESSRFLRFCAQFCYERKGSDIGLDGRLPNRQFPHDRPAFGYEDSAAQVFRRLFELYRRRLRHRYKAHRQAGLKVELFHASGKIPSMQLPFTFTGDRFQHRQAIRGQSQRGRT